MPDGSLVPVVELQIADRIHLAVDLPQFVARNGRSLDQYPYVIRVLLENLARHLLWSGGTTVTAAELSAVVKWEDNVGVELPLHVTRVILPDSSGVPVLQDLAALRTAVDRAGGDPVAVDVRIPVDLIVDHSLQVDSWGKPDSMIRNLRRELERNSERYSFIRWAQQAFKGLRVFPPGSGIIHQVNLERIAHVVMTARAPGQEASWAFPDFVIGGDSHTPMVNGLGVLGWGVGGIDAEAALLGHAYGFPVPEVVGVRLHGRRAAHAFTTDVALRITEVLRRAGVVNSIVEFFGPAVRDLTVPERGTLANMSPEYGATGGFFPIDERTIEFLRMTGRSEDDIALVEGYARACGFFRSDPEMAVQYSRVIEIDLSSAVPSMAGPRRPQDRIDLPRIAAQFVEQLGRPPAEGGFGAVQVQAASASGKEMPGHGAIVIAALTSCTNTSNPQVMLAAGIVARKAVAAGITPPWWVKRSLAPGSHSVTSYLRAAGLLAPLAALGFELVGYGCTTCGGKSGPLDVEVARSIEERQLVAVAVLSGNRNFEGRIHKLVRANYIGSPPLVVLYALAGRIDLDLTSEPVGIGASGQAVYMADLLPTADELDAAMRLASNPVHYVHPGTGSAPGTAEWDEDEGATGPLFSWDLQSQYLVEPPFFRTESAEADVHVLAGSLRRARVLAAFHDSLTTDHISPGGEIPPDTPAGRYLREAGILPKDFNTYVGRRGNYHVMERATFANIRLRNLLVPDHEGGFTRLFPDGEVMTIYEASTRYREAGIASIILAGKDYGSGSSRDWAAKGSKLLGVRAVLAESFERIHRANLVGMGVLPLAFARGESWRSLGLDGCEEYAFEGVVEGLENGAPISVTATHPNGRCTAFEVHAQVATAAERRLMASGGIPGSMLSQFVGAGARGVQAAEPALPAR